MRGTRAACRLLRQAPGSRAATAEALGSRCFSSGTQQAGRGAASAAQLGRHSWLVAVAAGLSAGLGLTYYSGGEAGSQCKAAEGERAQRAGAAAAWALGLHLGQEGALAGPG